MNKRDWKAIWRIIKDFSAGHKKILVCMLGLSVTQSVKPFAAVILMGMLLDAVYAGEGFNVLLIYSLTGLGCACLIAAVGACLTKIFNQHLEYMLEIENRPLNRKGMEMDFEHLEDVKIHDMRQRINGNLRRFGLTGGILSELNKLFRHLFTVLISVCIVLPMFLNGSHSVHGWIASWYVSVLFFVIIICLIWINFKVIVRFNQKHSEIKKSLAPYETRKKYYLETLSASETQKDLRLFGQQELYNREIEELASAEQKAGKKAAGCLILNGMTGQTTTALIGFLVYSFTGLRALAGIISIGNVVTYAASILKFTEAVANLAVVVGNLKEATLYIEDYVSYMDLPRLKYNGSLPVEKRRDNKFSVEFEHVSFRYPGSDQYVIKDLNLSFVIGEKMAIVGKNGSGKTTFIKLLCRLYDVTEGCIKVNGIDIRKYDYQQYCDLFSVVFQDFKMFAFPLGENIACSEEVDKELAMDALIKAGLKQRMGTLPDGLNTCIGKEYDEEGVNFSGGEKQKMAIARAIYKNAPFVIMDEPTAALDPESECEVYEGFDRMVGKKTAIYISHRLASCKFCEDILVFDQGRIVQRGNHEQLAGQEGLYQELWKAQAQYYA